MAEVLSSTKDYFVFDDLYFFRILKACKVQSYLTDQQLNYVIHRLGWAIRARIKYGRYAVPDLNLEDVDVLDKAMRSTFVGKKVHWSQFLQEWMVRLARHHNKECWGYKCPSDLFRWNTINHVFPGARFIFVHRDPRDMLASMKHVAPNDGNPLQYHPIAYALYWRRAAETAEQMQQKINKRSLAVDFESLVSDTDEIIRRLKLFLDTDVFDKCLRSGTGCRLPNSSFEGKKRKTLSPLEKWLTEKIVGRHLRSWGYAPGSGRFRWRDVPEVSRISVRFAVFQAKRFYARPEGRVAIQRYLSSLFQPRSMKHK
jgi:hypothetical protein